MYVKDCGALPRTPQGTRPLTPFSAAPKMKFSYGNAKKDSILHTVFLLSCKRQL